jgi:hypothetical protein
VLHHTSTAPTSRCVVLSQTYPVQTAALPFTYDSQTPCSRQVCLLSAGCTHSHGQCSIFLARPLTMEPRAPSSSASEAATSCASSSGGSPPPASSSPGSASNGHSGSLPSSSPGREGVSASGDSTQDTGKVAAEGERHPKGKRKRTQYASQSCHWYRLDWPSRLTRPPFQSQRQADPRRGIPEELEARQGGASRDCKTRVTYREGGAGRFCPPHASTSGRPMHSLLTSCLDLVSKPAPK